MFDGIGWGMTSLSGFPASQKGVRNQHKFHSQIVCLQQRTVDIDVPNKTLPRRRKTTQHFYFI